MNVYDFDKTIYPKDSTAGFYFYMLAKKPAIIRFLPVQFYHFVRFRLKIIDKTAFKEKFYIFLTGIGDTERWVVRYWDKKERKISSWYLAQKREDDIIISASPEFLLREIAKRLGDIHLIASVVDPKTGKYSGENCFGEEKVKRLNAVMPGAVIDKFYSDSYSDTPLAAIAKQAYFVKNGKLYEWKKK